MTYHLPCLPNCLFLKSSLSCFSLYMYLQNLVTSDLSHFRFVFNVNNISKMWKIFFLHVTRITLLAIPISILISRLTMKAIPLKLLLPLHWMTSSHLSTMWKPASEYALTSVQPSTTQTISYSFQDSA